MYEFLSNQFNLVLYMVQLVMNYLCVEICSNIQFDLFSIHDFEQKYASAEIIKSIIKI